MLRCKMDLQLIKLTIFKFGSTMVKKQTCSLNHFFLMYPMPKRLNEVVSDIRGRTLR